MPFKYEIWKYVGQEGLTNDEFLIGSYEKFADVKPNDSGASFELEKTDEHAFYRVQVSGDFIFSGNDFQTILDITTGDNTCEIFALFVYDENSGERSDFIKNNFWDAADYIGFIKKRSIEYDYDRCIARVQPETLDIYTGFLRRYDEEYNLLSIAADDKVWVSAEPSGNDGIPEGQYPTEYVNINAFQVIALIPSYITNEPDFIEVVLDNSREDVSKYAFIGSANGNSVNLNDAINASDFECGLLYNLEIRVFLIGPVNIDGETLVIWYTEYYTEFRREYKFLPAGETPEGDGWVLYDDTPPEYKWVRTPLNISDPSYTHIEREAELPAELPDGFDDFGDAMVLFKLRMIYSITSRSMPTRKRGIKLNDSIRLLREENESSQVDDVIKNKSIFFTNPVNPIDSESDFRNIVLLQTSDAQPTSDAATVLRMSLSSLLEILRYMNIRWVLEAPDNETLHPILRVEHERYFKRGGNYTGDFLIGYNVPKKDSRLILTYDEMSPPKRERVVTQTPASPSFLDQSITYPVGCSGDDDMEISYPIITDIQAPLAGIEIPPDGVMVLQTDRSYKPVPSPNPFPVFEHVYTVINKDVGDLTNQINGGLSTRNVLSTLWLDGRYAPRGRFSFETEDTDFINIKKQSNQDNVIIRLSYKQIEPYKLVSTDYDNGEIKTASFDIKNCLWRTTLAYE